MNTPDCDNVTRSPWLYAAQPFNIADNVYYAGNRSVSSHLFDTGEGLLLLDTTYSQTAYLLFESIRKLGFDPSSVRWILHSHAHFDHFGATRMLVEMTGAKTYMPRVDIPYLDEEKEMNLTEENGFSYEPPFDTYFNVDVPVDDGDEIRFGNTVVRAVAAPGHTPGTMAYFFTLPSGLTAAMHGGLGLNTLKSGFIRKHGLTGECREAYIESLERLHDEHVDITLGNHPGQSETFEKKAKKDEGGPNPFIDSTYWPSMIEKRLKMIKELCETDPV